MGCLEKVTRFEVLLSLLRKDTGIGKGYEIDVLYIMFLKKRQWHWKNGGFSYDNGLS